MSDTRSYAMLFPGQGSQSPGMLSDLHSQFPIVRETFEQASDIVGYDIWKLCDAGPEEQQRQTEFTQPLMYCSGIATLRAFRSVYAAPPTIMAGHSLGEFCALTAAGCLDFASGLELVKQRGTLMASAVPSGEGGMAAVLGMPDEEVISLCESVNGERVVEAVNFNAPGQVAVSGHLDAIQSLIAAVKERGGKARVLPVSVPNHSSLMQQAGATLADLIDAIDWQMTATPVMQNLSAEVADDVEALLEALRAHMYSPVQWTLSVQRMIERSKPDLFVEMGPGKVLAGLGRRIDRAATVRPAISEEGINELAAALSGGRVSA